MGQLATPGSARLGESVVSEGLAGTEQSTHRAEDTQGREDHEHEQVGRVLLQHRAVEQVRADEAHDRVVARLLTPQRVERRDEVGRDDGEERSRNADEDDREQRQPTLPRSGTGPLGASSLPTCQPLPRPEIPWWAASSAST